MRSTAQSLSACPGMLPGPGALWVLIPRRDLLILSGDSVTTQLLEGGVFCAGAERESSAQGCSSVPQSERRIGLVLPN